MSKLPLEGIRVADATTNWSGPYLTNLMATLGAQVIKVESIQRLDAWRAAGALTGIAEDFWERSPLWNSVNTDKLDITLDLTKPKGAELFKRLVKISDVVAENYTARVMENFGLDYRALREVNPGIVMISLPAHGATGPWRNYPGFAFSIEQMAGVPQLTGSPDGPPEMTGSAFTDPSAGVNAMAAVMMALLYRQVSGRGQYIDLSQIETTTCMIGDAIADWSMNQRIQPRRGNHHPYMAPHGTYPCRGDDLWVSIAVSSDEQWRGFREALGDPPWAREERFDSGLDRWRHREELDKRVEEWTRAYDHYEVMHILQEAGVAAGPVLTSAELLRDPHLKERGAFQPVDRSIVGTYDYPVPTAPMKFSKVPGRIRRAAPLLGEHNEYVLRELLGLSEEEMQGLTDEKIIGKALVEV